MKRIIGLFLCSIILSSCNFFRETGVDFEIKNNTDTALNKVQLKTSAGSKTKIFDLVKPGKSVSGFLEMKEDQDDGSYILEFEREGEKVKEIINEYFSAGNAISHKLIFEIAADTVYFNSEHYY